jgi:hypothetical protein
MSATGQGHPVLKRLRETALAALEERRGLVIYARIDAQEMDRMARQIEREAIEKIRAALPDDVDLPELAGVRNRLARMDEQLRALDARTEISDRSRALERDDITWRAFEDVVWLLGID